MIAPARIKIYRGTKFAYLLIMPALDDCTNTETTYQIATDVDK
jgi:hypothetical protein